MALGPYYARPGYHVQPAPGGSFHVYPDGHKEFVAHPGTSALGTAFTHAAQNTGTGPFAGNAAQWQAAAQATGTGPFAPASGASAAAAQAAPDPTSPMDSTLAGWMATHQAARDQQLAANEQQGTANLANYQEALRRLNQQQPIEEQGQRQSYNKQGLFYSGHLGQSLGRLAQSYTERRADQRSGYDTTENARLAARGAISAGYNVDEAAARAEAADRQIGSDTTAAGSNALALDPNAAPAAPAVKTAATTVRRPRAPAVSRVVQSVAPRGMGTPTRAPTTFRQTRKPKKRT